MLKKIRRLIDNERGDIFGFIIVVAIVAILAVVTLPKLNEKIDGTANNAIDRIDAMEEDIDATK